MDNEIKNIQVKNDNEIFIVKENNTYDMEVEITLFKEPDINSKIIHILSNQYIKRMMGVTQWQC